MRLIRRILPICMILAGSSLVFGANGNNAKMKIFIDGNAITKAQDVYIKNGVTMVPLRTIGEAIGATVKYDAVSRKINLELDGTQIALCIDSYVAKINDTETLLEVAPTIKNGTAMLPLRFISEYLGYDVDYNKQAGIISINKISNAVGSKKSIEEIKRDAYGNIIRKTDLPKNAKLFPYIQADIPNWAYEQQPWNDNIWGFKTTDNGYPQYRKVASFPKDTLEEYSDFWANNYEHLDKFIDALMNVDYRTINDQEWLDTMMNEFNPNSYTKNPTDMRAYIGSWLKSCKNSKWITKCEYRIMPETLWVDNMSRSVGFNFSVYMKWTLVSNTNKWYNVPGEAGAWNAKDLGTSYNGKTMEGIVTFHVDRKDNSGKYYIHYSLCSPESQLNPKCNLYNGLCPSQKSSTQDNSFVYAWAGKDSKPVGRYDDVDAPSRYAY